MAWSSLTNHDKSTSETLLDRRAQLRQQYFTRLLPLWISKHREHLARNFNIDGGAIAVLNLVKGPSIRPSKFTRDAEREGDNVLELLQCIRDGQSANSQELADIKKLLGEKIPLLEGVAEDVRHVLNLMERRCELSDVEFRRECNRLARRLQSHRIN
jgi:hypothetical protein